MPALTGLGSPQWDPDARGLICGLTRGSTRAHLARAALEAIAHQVADVLEVLPLEVGVLRADGGASANGFLMQFQADLIGTRVEVSSDAEATALGAAALAGLGVGHLALAVGSGGARPVAARSTSRGSTGVRRRRTATRGGGRSRGRSAEPGA